jgi:signal transduction histidine kinase
VDLFARRRFTGPAMTLLWVTFTLAYVCFFYVYRDAREIADASLDGYLEVILLGVPTIVMFAGTLWLRESGVDDDLRPRLLGWTLAMAVLFVGAIHATLFVVEAPLDNGERPLILLMSTGFGASAGTVTGMTDIVSKQRERARIRSLRVARRVERERSQLERLNQFLRHEVLNEATKIVGFADLMAERTSDEERAGHLQTIRHSGEEIAVFIDSIRTILEEAGHDPDLSPVDLRAVVEREAQAVRNATSGVDVEVTAPGPVSVLGGDLLGRVFRNLIENAVEHNDDVAITVEVVRDGGWVRAHVRDDGDGIPAERRGGLFDPPESGNHGYGLYLTRNLVEVYGGRLELAETGTTGTEFVVSLPAADVTTSGPTGRFPGAA